MSMLRTYINRIMTGKGLSRQAQLANLRFYLNTEPFSKLEIAISDLTSLRQLRILWEAGLHQNLQAEVLRRHTELTERRGG